MLVPVWNCTFFFSIQLSKYSFTICGLIMISWWNKKLWYFQQRKNKYNIECLYCYFQVEKGIDVNILMFIPTVVIGVIGGLLGAAFTILNLKITRGRRKLLASFHEHVIMQKLFRVFEPALIMVRCVFVQVIFIPILNSNALLLKVIWI